MKVMLHAVKSVYYIVVDVASLFLERGGLILQCAFNREDLLGRNQLAVLYG